MYTKSKIQQINECILYKNMFLENLNHLMDQYLIEDSIFVPCKDTIKEATIGYFNIVDEFDSFEKLKENYQLESPCVRIVNNNKFQVGNLYETLSQCTKSDKIYDIKPKINIQVQKLTFDH